MSSYEESVFWVATVSAVEGVELATIWDSGSDDGEDTVITEVALVRELGCTKSCNSYGRYSKCVAPIWKPQTTKVANSVCTYVAKRVILVSELFID
jgi:hypothetical protein